jgi:hypothetical protein
MEGNLYHSKEDVLLNLINQIDSRFVKPRKDYALIKHDLENFKQVLTENKIKTMNLLKNIAQ